METLRAMQIKLGLAATIAMVALPSVATAQQVVPAGNAAATQYTEAFPTARGNAKVHRHGKRAPANVLGPRKARHLEAAGPQGQAVAEVVAATAPAASQGDKAPANSAGGKHGAQTDRPAGASPLGKVIGAATGSSDSGEMGLLLPIFIVCVLAASAAYFLRQRRRVS